MPSNIDVRESIGIETSGDTVSIGMVGRDALSLHIRGDAAADYAIDVRDTRDSGWILDAGPTYTGSADYDDVVTTGVSEVRIRCTTGTATTGAEADVYLAAGGN